MAPLLSCIIPFAILISINNDFNIGYYYSCSCNNGYLHRTAPVASFLACFYKINKKIHRVPLIAASRLCEGWNYMRPAADWHE